jgi:hypothetical protein
MGFPDADPNLLDQLVATSRQFDGTQADPQRNCWMAVHQHVHGVLPSEYDIREVPEDLYLAVLERRQQHDQGLHGRQGASG